MKALMATPTNTVFDVTTPAALVTETASIVFCNTAFQQTFGMRPGQPLLNDMASLFQRSVHEFEAAHGKVATTAEALEQSSTEQVMHLQLTYLKGDSRMESGLWLMTIRVVINAHASHMGFLKRKDFTPREIEVATLVREGLRDKAIGDRLCISVHTVNQHLKKIHQKCGTHARSTLVSRLNAEGRQLP